MCYKVEENLSLLHYSKDEISLNKMIRYVCFFIFKVASVFSEAATRVVWW